MEDVNQKSPPNVVLTYNKGDLIIKEGNYGTSIYKIINGSVQLFTHAEDREITLSLLGPGEIFGELLFFSKNIATRPSSVRAIEYCVVEAWHPESLGRDYDAMPFIIKHITYELLNRRIRMNKLIAQMTPKEKSVSADPPQEDKPPSSRRRSNRKPVALHCTYRPVDASPKLRLKGYVRDISISGANMEVQGNALTNFSHDPGEEFFLDLTLPNGKDIHLTARILSLRERRMPGTVSFGMVFTDMREGSKKELGFFLMP